MVSLRKSLARTPALLAANPRNAPKRVATLSAVLTVGFSFPHRQASVIANPGRSPVSREEPTVRKSLTVATRFPGTAEKEFFFVPNKAGMLLKTIGTHGTGTNEKIETFNLLRGRVDSIQT